MTFTDSLPLLERTHIGASVGRLTLLKGGCWDDDMMIDNVL